MFKFLRVFAILLVSLFTQIGSNDAFAIVTACPKGQTIFNSPDGNCIPCPRGYYCPDTTTFAIPCGLGKYSYTEGSTSCETCPTIPSGWVSDGYSYANTTAIGAQYCYIAKTYGGNCTAGQRVAYPKPMPLLDGSTTYSWTSGINPMDTTGEFTNIAYKAKAGYYVDGYTCVACPAGTYQGTNGSTATSCTPCKNWTYNPSTGQSSCESCLVVPTNFTKVDSTSTGWTSASKCIVVSNSLGDSTSGCESATTYLKQVTSGTTTKWQISTTAPYESTASAKPGYAFAGSYSGHYPSCTACPTGTTSRGGSNQCGYKFELSANGGTMNSATNGQSQINYLLAEESGEKFVNVTFVDNGTTSTEFIDSYTYVDFVPYYTMQLPTRTNYTFKGFYTAASGGIQMIDDKGYLTSAFTNASPSSLEDYYTFFAQYEPATYTISYTLNGGTAASNSPKTYTYGTTTSIGNPTRTGYTFAGWCDNAALTTNCSTNKTISATTYGNKSFYAKWTANTYNITYVMNSGTNYSDAPTTYTYGVGATINGTPTRSGYTFAGWCDDAALTTCSITRTISPTATGNKTFYAKWTGKTIALKWSNGGRGTAPTSPTSCTYGSTFTTPAALTATGYTFANWTVNSKNFSANTSVTCDYTNLGLYSGTATISATWTPKTITVTLNSSPGSGSTSKIYVRYNTGVYKSSTSFTSTYQMTTTKNNIATPYYNDANTFMGYYTGQNGTGTKFIDANGYITSNFSTTHSASNYTLYAYWVNTGVDCPDGYTAPAGATSIFECQITCQPGYGILEAGSNICAPLRNSDGATTMPYYFTGYEPVQYGRTSVYHVCPFYSAEDPEFSGAQIFDEAPANLHTSTKTTCTSPFQIYGMETIDITEQIYEMGDGIEGIHIYPVALNHIDLYYMDGDVERKVPDLKSDGSNLDEFEQFINIDNSNVEFDLLLSPIESNDYQSEYDQYIALNPSIRFTRVVLYINAAHVYDSTSAGIELYYSNGEIETIPSIQFFTDGSYRDIISHAEAPVGFSIPLNIYRVYDDNGDPVKQCEPGTYLEGYYFDPTMDTSCIQTSPGYYTEEYMAFEQIACPVGTYQPDAGQSTCELASQGYYTTACLDGDMACTSQTQCTGATYCVDGIQNNCPSVYIDNTDAGKFAENQCQMYVPGGYYVETSQSDITSQCVAGTFKGEHMLRYGDTSSCSVCGDNQYSVTGAAACETCPSGYVNSGDAATAHAGESSCYTTCSAGQRVVSAGEQCTSPAGNWFYGESQDVNYGNVSAVNYCMDGYTASGTTAAGHDAATDCKTTVPAGQAVNKNTITARYVRFASDGYLDEGGAEIYPMIYLNEIQAFTSNNATGTNLLDGVAAYGWDGEDTFVLGNNNQFATDSGATDGDFNVSSTYVGDADILFDMGENKEIGSFVFSVDYGKREKYKNVQIFVATADEPNNWIPVMQPTDIETSDDYANGIIINTVVVSDIPRSCAANTYRAGNTALTLTSTLTCSSCPTDVSSRTVSSNAGSNTSSACFVTCPPKTVANAQTTSIINNTIHYSPTNEVYPACTYNVTCNAGYSAQDNNTSNPMCTANCNAITLDANGGTSGVITTVYKKTDDTTNVYSDNQCTTTLNGIIGSQIKPTRDGYTSLGFYGEQYESITGVQEQISTENSKLYLISAKNYVASDEFKKLNVTAPMTIYAAWAKNCPETVPNGSCQLDGVVMGEVVYTTSCDTGYTISGNGTANPICTANTYTCQSGQYLDVTTCKPCDAGYYCPSESQTYTYNGEIQGRTDCPAGSYCPAESTEPMACTDLGGGLYANSNAKSTKPEDCYITTTAGYYIANNTDTTETECRGYGTFFYCPSTTLNWPNTGGNVDCPNPNSTTYADTFPEQMYDGQIKSIGFDAMPAKSATIDKCSILYWLDSKYGLEFIYAGYNTETGKYDKFSKWGYASINPGYYLAARAACGSYAYYHEIHECEPNSYCPGKEPVACNASNQAEVHTETFGLEPCPETYPISVGGTDAKSINVCNLTLDAGEFVETAGNGASTCPAGAYCVGGATIYYDQTGGADVCPENTYSNSGASACSACDTENGYTNSGTTFASHANASSCVTTCAAGTYVKDAKSACTAVDISGKYMGEHNVAYGSISTLETCPVGASGSDNGRETNTDCYYTCPAQTTPNGDVTATNANEYYNGTTYPTCTYTTTCDTGYELNADGTACVARVFKITLSPNTDDTLVTRGTEYVYVRYGDGMYLDAELTKKMTIGGTENVIEIPTRNGYTITYGRGFTLDETNNSKMIISGHTKTITEYFNPTMFTSDTTIYADWQPITYNITLDSGSDITNNPTTTLYSHYNINVYRDAPIELFIMTETSNPVTIPTRDGYVFDGFYSKQNGAGDLLVGPNGYITSTLTSTYINSPNTDDNITFYAKWTAATCNITNGIGTPSVSDNTVTCAITCNTGYGHNTGTVTGSKNSATVSAECTANEYNVTYSCGTGATGTAPASNTATYDSDYSLQTNTCTKTGYKFTGWSDGTEIYDEGYTFKPWQYAEVKTYTAQWEQVIINCNAGTYYAGSGKECSPCESGHYCAGGEFTIGNGTLGGIKKCPTEYPNTENDTFATKITDCFSDTKQREWTGNQQEDEIPENCYAVTWNECSVDACEYTAYANEDGTGDGAHRDGCEEHKVPCTMTVKSVTATSGYYVSGTSCMACSELANGMYPNSDANNTGGESACYTNEISGAVIATTNASNTTKCANWEYKESHTVKYGDTSSCNACPDLTDGWTKYDSTGTGWTSFTQCVQKQTPMNCKSGTVKQTAIDATTWGATTLDVTLIANAGFYASDTALSCSQCPDNGNSDTDATEITSCYNYQDCTLGSGSGKKQCYYDDNDYTNCGICNVSDCQPGYELKSGACAECPAGTYSAMGTECVVCNDNTYSYAHASRCNACLTERGYGNQGNDADSHAGEESCITTCNAGTYVSAIGGQCENVGAGFWGVGGQVNQTQTSERHACEYGLTTIGYGYGANEAGDCGRILHAGAYTIYLRSEQATNPSLHAYVDGKTLFGNMSASQTSGGLKVKYNDTIYSVVNE